MARAISDWLNLLWTLKSFYLVSGRRYRLCIHEDGTLDDGDITFVDMTQLFESGKQPFPPGGLDPEGFTLGRAGFFFMSSEGNPLASPIIDPFIRRYNRNGRVTADLPTKRVDVSGEGGTVTIPGLIDGKPVPAGRHTL